MVETRKKRGGFCFRNRNNKKNYSGGGLGHGYAYGTEMLTRGSPVIDAYSSCGAVARSGTLTTAEISGMKGGLPGLTGGSRKRRAQRKQSKKSRKGSRKYKMRGGRYETVFAGAEYDALGPRGGMLATAGRIACETGVAPHVSPTQSTAPAVAMSGGGALQLAPTPFLQEATAGYTHEASKFLDSVGAPIMLNVPVGGRMGTPACSQTGGANFNSVKRQMTLCERILIESLSNMQVVRPLDVDEKTLLATIIKKYQDNNDDFKDYIGKALIFPFIESLDETTQQIIKEKYSKKAQMSMPKNSQSPPPATQVPYSAPPPPPSPSVGDDKNDENISRLLGKELEEQGLMPRTESAGGRRRKHRKSSHKHHKTQRKQRKANRKQRKSSRKH